jgi:4-hydroxy-tetrahydrodipicolinate synthase
MIIKGLGTALVTPFSSGKVDFDALERLIEYQIQGGVDFLVTMGTTGEAVTLSASEIEEVVRFTIKVNAERLPIVMGMGGNNTAALADQMQSFDFEGITAVLSASPAYNKPPQDGIIRHYEEVAKVCPIPIIVYNVPGRTASNISAETTIALSQIDGLIGIKEASGDLTQTGRFISKVPDHFSVLSGDDPTAYHLRGLGGHGCISVMSNIYPDLFRKVVYYDSDQQREALDLHLETLPIHPWLYIHGNPAGIKAALRWKGICGDEVRLPLTSMNESHMASLISALEAFEASLI